MSGKSEKASEGIGFGGLLTILFIGLKLTGYINWSWWWVLSPIWLPITALLVFFALAIGLGHFLLGIANLLGKGRRS